MTQNNTEVRITMECFVCDAELNAVGLLNNLMNARSALQEKAKKNNWQQVKFGRHPVGFVCPECAEPYMKGTEEAERETDEEGKEERTYDPLDRL